MSLAKKLLEHRFPKRTREVNYVIAACSRLGRSSEKLDELCKRGALKTEAELDAFMEAAESGERALKEHLASLEPQEGANKTVTFWQSLCSFFRRLVY